MWKGKEIELEMFKKYPTEDKYPIRLRIRRDLFRLTVHICIILSIYFLAFLLILSIYFENVTEKKPQNKLFKRRILSNINSKKYDSSLIDYGMNFENECFFDSDSCFNLFRCLNAKDQDTSLETNFRNKLKVYIYDKPFRKNSLEKYNTSKEFKEFIDAILESDFYESNPSRACLFVPFVDLLNEIEFNATEVENYLHNLDFWNPNGRNHFLFNMIPKFGTKLSIKFKAAIVTSSKFESNTIRNGFDMTLPFFNPFTAYEPYDGDKSWAKRKHFLITTQISLSEEFIILLRDLEDQNDSKRIEIFSNCINPEAYNNSSMRCSTKDGNLYDYKTLLANSKFCLISNQNPHSNEHALSLFDSLKFNCIPILLTNEWLLPFSEFIDWSLISIQLNQHELKNVFKILDDSYSDNELEKMIEQQKFIFTKYFSSIKNITHAFLTYFESRLNPMFSTAYESWNLEKTDINQNPLVIPYKPENPSFTALILGLKSLEKVKNLIESIMKNCSSGLNRIILLWYGQNDKKTIEQLNSLKSNIIFFKIMKYFHNSNRFYPFDEIETELVLHLDERMSDFNGKHLEKALNIWTSFSDRFIWIENLLEMDKASYTPFLFSSYYNHYYFDLNSREKSFKSNNFFEIADCETNLMEMLVKRLTGEPSIFTSGLNLKSFESKMTNECYKFLNNFTFSSNKNISGPLEIFDHSKILHSSIFL